MAKHHSRWVRDQQEKDEKPDSELTHLHFVLHRAAFFQIISTGQGKRWDSDDSAGVEIDGPMTKRDDPDMQLGPDATNGDNTTGSNDHGKEDVGVHTNDRERVLTSGNGSPWSPVLKEQSSLEREDEVDFKSDAQKKAIEYARTHFVQFFASHQRDIERLMGSCLFLSNPDDSPYPDFSRKSNHAGSIEPLFVSVCLRRLQLPRSDPVLTSFVVGTQVLPNILKVSRLIKENAGLLGDDEVLESQVDVELSAEHQYHSTFVCPISREQASAANPPVLLKCGHVISRSAMQQVARVSRLNRFKCPTCPQEQTQAETLVLNI